MSSMLYKKNGEEMQTNRTLVEKALQRAEEYEKQGNKKRANYFLDLAERADKVYDKLESGEKDILKNAE